MRQTSSGSLITRTEGRSDMSKTSLPSPELLRKLLVCDPLAGKLFWRERDISFFSSAKSWKTWNTRFSGKEAFTADDGKGYLRGTIFGKTYQAHRVIWAIVTGVWPIDQIDHEDHDKANNRFVNLRDATHQENAKNQSLQSNNTSGFTGVSWLKAADKWVAEIIVDRNKVYLGCFEDKRDAIAVRKAANEKYKFHANHGLEL